MTLSDERRAAIAPGGRRSVSQVPPAAYVYLAIIVLTWAGNWPLMKLAIAQAPPLTFVLLRLVGSLVLIGPALVAARQPLLPRQGERSILFWVRRVAGCRFSHHQHYRLVDPAGGAGDRAWLHDAALGDPDRHFYLAGAA